MQMIGRLGPYLVYLWFVSVHLGFYLVHLGFVLVHTDLSSASI